MCRENEAKVARPSYVRDHAGRFAPGGRGGPGRMPHAALHRFVQGAKLLVPTRENAVNALQVMSAGAPAAAARCVQIATRSRNEAAALRAAELVISYVHGLPVQRALIAATSVDAASTPEERRERLQSLFARVREVCGPGALPAVIDAQPLDEPCADHGQEVALDGEGG